ncbi:Histidine kinase [Paraburkholderia caribensis]|nr:Histidine kinase [Paraburkholderia caribensis]
MHRRAAHKTARHVGATRALRRKAAFVAKRCALSVFLAGQARMKVDLDVASKSLAHRRAARAQLAALSCGLAAVAVLAVVASNGAATLALVAALCALSIAAAVVSVIAAARTQALSTSNAGRDESRMMGIIRSSMEAIITIDEAQNIVIFNPTAERIFGVSAAQALGTPLSRFIPQRYRDSHAQHVAQFGATGISERIMGRQPILFGLRANGEEFPLEASISQIREDAGKLYTVMLRDVTERVKSENALKQSREELRRLSANLQSVREEEKTRIARELHDDLGQQLTALKMELSVLEDQLTSRSGTRERIDAMSRLHGMARTIDATVASLRRIAADLRPVMLDDLGLAPAIEWLANDFTSRYGIAVERYIDAGDAAFKKDAATALFRIVQEALTNVARHAEASAVELTLHASSQHYVLRIADNGRGAEPDAGTGEHAGIDRPFGLIGVRERAHMLGGSVRIDTTRNQGFALTVTFPLQAVQQEHTHP